MQLIKDYSWNIEAVFGVGIRWEDLVEAVGWFIDQPFLLGEDLTALL